MYDNQNYQQNTNHYTKQLNQYSPKNIYANQNNYYNERYNQSRVKYPNKDIDRYTQINDKKNIEQRPYYPNYERKEVVNKNNKKYLTESTLKSTKIETFSVKAAKGKFFVYTLHSGRLFTRAVDVKWAATITGKPDLPPWLHIFQSKHNAISYLIGTPVTSANLVSLHIIARKIDTYETGEFFLNIELTEDVRYNNYTQQIAEIHIRNVNAENLISNSGGKIDELETSIRQTFKGKDLNPYIFNIESPSPPDGKVLSVLRDKPLGAIIYIGTQRKFHSNVFHLMKGLQNNFKYCNNSQIIPFNKYFHKKFDINWCKFNIKNSTMPKSLHDLEMIEEKKLYRNETVLKLNELSGKKEESSEKYTPYYHFWESVLIFPLLAVFCILLVLLLSVIFFGRREGQHWRDYKTPKEQLQEYMAVRESQQRLRELSVQRQMMSMAASVDRNADLQSDNVIPSGIGTFLQPKHRNTDSENYDALLSNSSNNNPKMYSSQYLNQKKLNDKRYRLPTTISTGSMSNMASIGSQNHSDKDLLFNRSTTVGKQTVAEAAKATGSSLHLYKNPFDDIDDDKDFDLSTDINNYAEIEEDIRNEAKQMNYYNKK
ncbi:Sarcoglycan alphaepsilon family-containing protein [Strongyloides ratti]|uniref:Sarcoglycan alphaepsilon family-containing protein n=1 Tax=Strongyloides ratti TaxID=34506 RepID=A0A090LU62_STRRB|nr:Sarcoglycan alphaepsilon family-containing protein [Strongyloides ratti]CEF71169.1 Sarcoglycan alphaepsilon family-containing protein [Strongyloides ratti]